ncbi:MAG: AAA family ATPase [Gemmatimonadaceae bacterium]
MPRRTVLTISGAVGPDVDLDTTLAPLGFAPADVVVSPAELIDHLHAAHYDLLLLPLDGVGDYLGQLEPALRADPAMSVVGTGATADPELILRGLRLGAHEFLVRPAPAPDLVAAIERAQRRVSPDGRRGRIVAVFSQKGGMGVTTVAINLAVACAAVPRQRVALVDLGEDDPDIRLFLNLAPAYDLTDLLARGDDVDGSVIASILTEHPSGVWVLPAAERGGRAGLDPAAVAAMLGHLRAHFDVIVVDADSSRRPHVLAALDAAQRILLVTQLSLPALRSAQQASQWLRERGYGDDKVQVLMNRVSGGDAVSLADAREVLGRDIAHTLPNDHRSCTTAVARGVALRQAVPEARLTKRFEALASQVLENAPPAVAVPAPGGDRPVARGFSRLFHFGD